MITQHLIVTTAQMLKDRLSLVIPNAKTSLDLLALLRPKRSGLKKLHRLVL